MSTCNIHTLPEEVSASDIAAVESALRHLDAQRKNRQVLGHIAQWFLVLKMYKEVERNFTRLKDRKQNEAKHRAMLTTLMGFGEILLTESEEIPSKDFDLICSSRESLVANVRYLRDKYEQWFVEIDENEMNRVWPKLIGQSV